MPAPTPPVTPAWFADAVIYEIYPQSFADSNGDGIGDFPGVIDHLDHLEWLGINTIWFNPCFASPFNDAGYDVSDYLQVAPRYGTNADLERLVEEAGKRGIRVLLDLVAGHTSDQHVWFQAELHADGPSPGGDRYIWADRDDGRKLWSSAPGQSPWVRSPGPRPGYYLKNFYASQPALNFGYAVLDDAEPWRVPADAPGPRRNIEALKEVMSYWFDRGVAGFRVDMAFSLVKMDDGFVQSNQIWRELREWRFEHYPETVIVPEGREPAGEGIASFDADFFLVIYRGHGSLFNNGGAGVLPWYEPAPCFFDAEGLGSTAAFLQEWAGAREFRPQRPVILATADHDYSRLACGSRDQAQLGAAFTFLLTWGSIPSIYYGDEIGQRYVTGLPEVEGSVVHPTYNRSGCRTPMQWDGRANAGFSSTGDPDRLYLPIDPDPERPTVAGQLEDPDSTLHLVRRLLQLRRETPALATSAPIRVLNEGYPFVYLRGDRHLVAVNPRRDATQIKLAELEGLAGLSGTSSALIAQGAKLTGGELTGGELTGGELAGGELAMDGFGYGIFELSQSI